MLSYDNLWKTMKDRNMTKYKLWKEHGIARSLLRRMRDGGYVGLYTIDRLCKILDCKIEDIVTYVPDKEDDTKV